MPIAEVNGTRLHYRFDGPEDAPVLMMSNSLGTDLHMWDGQVETFTQHFRLLRYDSRGHGKSAAPEGPYSIDMLCQDAVGLLDAVGIAKPHFCGLSMGGMVGQWLAVNMPGRVGRLVLCNTSAHLPPRSLWDGRIEAVTAGGMEAVTQAVVERWFTAGFRSEHRDVVAKVRAMLLATPPAGYAASCMAIRDMDQRQTVSAIAALSMIVVGAHDPATPPDHGQFLQRAIHGSRLATIEAAHLSNIEAAAAFNQAVVTFLTN
ncbi:MAG: 3-oxoadipate enol-lactonase [Hyphomicrobiales bacterium]|nr:3-oxoadipate enol-lactonase [Hyphomicrobiales bacterium]